MAHGACCSVDLTCISVPALCALYEESAILDPFPPMANVTAVTTLCPPAGPLRFLLSPKTQTMSQNKRCFALRQFPGHFVVHMPSCPLSCVVSRISCLVFGGGAEGTAPWGRFPWGCEARSRLLDKGGRGVVSTTNQYRHVPTGHHTETGKRWLSFLGA